MVMLGLDCGTEKFMHMFASVCFNNNFNSFS